MTRATRLRPGLVLALLAGLGGFRGILADEPDARGVEFFEKRIRPVLVDRCYSCHSEQARDCKALKAGLLLDSRDGMLAGGESGPAIVPGNVAESLLIASIRHETLKMPPKGGKLADEVIADFVRWVEMGAPDPRLGGSKRPDPVDLATIRREHWAFRPLARPEPPRVRDETWARTPIDAFILAKLEASGISPAAEVDPGTLLRRAYLDLIGLPPSPAERREFLRDPSAAAFEKVVDDLLSRPQYGERWGRHWLDVARYAETQGYERDEIKPFAWRFRDWVIDALNRDIPYDRFLTEQIAGDELEDVTTSSLVATTFHALGPFDTLAAEPRRARYDQLDDVLGTVASAFLGQTVQCARCHDHKFEPIAQADYYRMLAAFEPLEGGDKPIEVGSVEDREAHRRATEAIEAERAPVVAELEGLQREILERPGGRPDEGKPRLEGNRLKAVVAALKVPAAERPKAQQDQLSRSRARLDESVRLAASAEESARIEALRVRIAEIDGRRPAPVLAWAFREKGPEPNPTHILLRGEPERPGSEVAFGPPAVLDSGTRPTPSPRPGSSGRRLWLARWMTSNAAPLVARVMVNRVWQHHFGQGFVPDANDLGVHGGAPSHPELLDWLAEEFVRGGWTLKRLHKRIMLSNVYRMSGANPVSDADPDGRLLSRFPVHRLESEVIRDSMLAVGGTLNLKMGGPSVHPPFDGKIVGDSAGVGWERSTDAEADRRSVYVFAKRAIPLPELELLGLPDSSASCGQRQVSTTPIQSLLLLNGTFADRQSHRLADRLRREAGDDPSARASLAFELVLGRSPRPRELESTLAFLAKQGDDRLQAFCLVLMNTNEFVYAN